MAQRHTIDSDKEFATTICRLSSGELVRGSEAVGKSQYNVRLRVGCPQGEVFALAHSHPGGEAVPSPQDISEAKRLGIRNMCISNERETRCWRIK